MCESAEELAAGLRTFVAAFDAFTLSGSRALELVNLFSEMNRLTNAAQTLAAGRVSETRAWHGTGANSATESIASSAGRFLNSASAMLDVAHQLKSLQAVRSAFVSGRLSEVQVREIAAAATEDPSEEEALLLIAERESVASLREQCRDVRAAAIGDEDACERIRRGRYFRHWTDRDGAVRLDGRLAPDDAAPLLAAVNERAVRLRDEAVAARRRGAGSVERAEAYSADAIVSLVDGSGAPRAVVHVHVSQSALERGRTVAGETSRIQGVGPVSVSAVRRLAMKGDVRVIETDGVAVGRVAHAGRTISAHLRTALETRYPACVVPGCNRRIGLQIDHVIALSEGGQTTIENLVRLCREHHGRKTHHGARLSRSGDGWVYTERRGPTESRGP